MRYIAGALVLIFLPVMFLSFLVGLHSQPWSSVLFGQRSGPIRAVPIGDLPISIPVPTVGIVPPTTTGRLEGIVDVARSWLGVRYVWGGCTRGGIDCSCAIRTWWAALGILAPRTTTEQIRWAIPVPLNQVQIGDALFFNNTCSDCGGNPTHVAMVIDPVGHKMIHAGDPVQIESYDTPYWRAHYAAAGRPRT